MSRLNGRVRRLEKAVRPDIFRMSDDELRAIAATNEEIAEFLISLGYPPTLEALTDEQLNSLVRDLEAMIGGGLVPY